MRDRDTPNITGLMRAEGRAREEAEKYKRMYQEREAAAKNGPNSTLLEQVAEKSKEIDRLAGMLEEPAGRLSCQSNANSSGGGALASLISSVSSMHPSAR